jgi:hypothetical protein
LDDVSPFPSQGLQCIIRVETLYIVSHPFQEGMSMDFYAVLDQVLDLLRQRGRVTYNAIKRQFGLDDACLQDLKDEIIAAQRAAVEEEGTVLVWAGDVTAPPPASCRTGVGSGPRASPESGAAGLHAAAPGRENPHLPHCPGR